MTIQSTKAVQRICVLCTLDWILIVRDYYDIVTIYIYSQVQI